MYSWSDDMASWYRPGAYRFGEATREARDAAASEAELHGPRTYARRHKPLKKITDPRKHIRSSSANPLLIAVDVTGSMGHWPFEIFDRLPLLYNTLSQYRPDLEVSFLTVGDAGCDSYPLQVTAFASGYALEQQLGAIYGEGGGGDEPESYGLLAHYINTHVETPNAKRPFLIVFGDATMHPEVPARQIHAIMGDNVQSRDSIDEWKAVTRNWNTWFLRRPGGSRGDVVDKQWSKAVGGQKIVHMTDEARAVDYAMGLIARHWGHFDDFEENMSARQEVDKVKELAAKLDEVVPRLLACPRCGAPLPVTAIERVECEYCRAALVM
jgi:hypothetical protein